MRHTGNTLHLRRFAPHDSASIITWPQSRTEAQWWVGPHVGWPVPHAAVQRWHADPDVHPYVLSAGATLFGYGELWMDAEEQEVELARLIVAPAQRGQGGGVALVQRLLAEVKRTEFPRVFLRVVPDNHVAIACYVRVGFTPVESPEQQLFNRGQPVDYLWMGYANQPTTEEDRV